MCDLKNADNTYFIRCILMKKIGLVSGLGWVSTLEYYRLINTYVREKRGGHYSAHIIMESLDEGAFIDQQAADPSGLACEKMIVDAVGVLVDGGAEVIALCANGIHRFESAIKQKHGIDIVHIADATAFAIKSEGINQVGLLGVKATMEGEFYKSRLNEFNIELLIPNKSDRENIHDKIVSELVLNIFNNETKGYFAQVIKQLGIAGAQGLILGCTEIPLLIKENECNGVRLFSTTEIHCRAIVENALM